MGNNSLAILYELRLYTHRLLKGSRSHDVTSHTHIKFLLKRKFCNFFGLNIRSENNYSNDSLTYTSLRQLWLIGLDPIYRLDYWNGYIYIVKYVTFHASFIFKMVLFFNVIIRLNEKPLSIKRRFVYPSTQFSNVLCVYWNDAIENYMNILFYIVHIKVTFLFFVY